MNERREFRTVEIHNSVLKSGKEVQSSADISENCLFQGDNLEVMKYLSENGYREKVNLIYLDPPFFSNTDYSLKTAKEKEKVTVFSDFSDYDREAYLSFLGDRLAVMRELLSPDGSIYLHLDWHAVHYAKVLMDRIFGSGNFRNEIIWHYYLGGKSRRFFARKHDTILFYTKSDRWKFNSLKVRRRLDYVPGLPARSSTGHEIPDTTGKDDAGWYSIVTADDVWEIPGVFNLSREYTGFPTQKPVALLQRIIEASTDGNDLVADFFCGSGTTLLAAQNTGRRWIGSDLSPIAVNTSMLRLIDPDTMPPSVVRIMVPHKAAGDITASGSNTHRILDSLGASACEDEYFTGFRDRTVIRIADPGQNVSSGTVDELADRLRDSSYDSAILISDSWALEANDGVLSIGNLKRRGIELVNFSGLVLYPPHDQIYDSDALPLLHSIRDFEIGYGNGILNLKKFHLQELNRKNTNEERALDIKSAMLWQIDGRYNGKVFAGRTDRDMWRNPRTGANREPEIEFRGMETAASRILFGNSGRILTVLHL